MLGLTSSRRHALLALPFGLWLAACKEDEPKDKPEPDTTGPTTGVTPPTEPPDTVPDDTGPTSTTADTADSGTLPSGVFDCGTIPELPLTITSVPSARAYHDVIFTDDDKLMGSDTNALLKVDIAGTLEVFVPDLGFVQQMDWAPDGTGDLLVAVDDNASVTRITPAGAMTVLATGIAAYGLRVGPDGFLYTANMDVIHRIDPLTGQKSVWMDPDNTINPKVLDWSVDGTKLYFGTNGGNGEVYQVDLDAYFDPISPPVLLATGIGTWHDGLGVDICGNIYIADYTTRALYRITPNMSIQTLWDPSDLDLYGHGLRWGTGQGGWSDTTLYQPQPYNGDTVVAIDIGIPYRTWPGTVVGTVPF